MVSSIWTWWRWLEWILGIRLCSWDWERNDVRNIVKDKETVIVRKILTCPSTDIDKTIYPTACVMILQPWIVLACKTANFSLTGGNKNHIGMWHCIPFRSAWNDIRMYKRILCGFLIQTVDNNLQGTGTVCEGLLNAKVISDEFCILKIYFAGKSTVDCFIFVLGKGSLLPTPELRLRFCV